MPDEVEEYPFDVEREPLFEPYQPRHRDADGMTGDVWDIAFECGLEFLETTDSVAPVMVAEMIDPDPCDFPSPDDLAVADREKATKKNAVITAVAEAAGLKLTPEQIADLSA